MVARAAGHSLTCYSGLEKGLLVVCFVPFLSPYVASFGGRSALYALVAMMIIMMVVVVVVIVSCCGLAAVAGRDTRGR